MPGSLAPDDILRLQQILATESASISLDRLSERNPGTVESLREHLVELRDRGLVVETSDGEWRVSDRGVESLKELGQYGQIGILYDMYTAAGDSGKVVEEEDVPSVEGLSETTDQSIDQLRKDRNAISRLQDCDDE